MFSYFLSLSNLIFADWTAAKKNRTVFQPQTTNIFHKPGVLQPALYTDIFIHRQATKILKFIVCFEKDGRPFFQGYSLFVVKVLFIDESKPLRMD